MSMMPAGADTNTCAFTEYRSGQAGEIPRPFWTEIEFRVLS
jgi:hypothetical protein